MRNKLKDWRHSTTKKKGKECMVFDDADTIQMNSMGNDVKEKGNMDTAIEIVMDYLREDDTNYAIMLDGSWGSGKTFFVTEKLVPEITRGKQEKVKKVTINEQI